MRIEKCIQKMDKETMKQAQELMVLFGLNDSNTDELESLEIEAEKNQMSLLDFINEVTI